MIRLTSRLFQVGGSHLTHPWDASSYLIASEPAFLVDCGGPLGADGLLNNIAELGLAVSSIRAIIGTHGHYDHVGAASRLKAEYGLELWLHEEDCAAVERSDPDLTCAGFFYGTTFPPTVVDRRLGDAEVLALDSVQITLLHTPGHTPGSLCVLVRDGDYTVLIAGDTVWGGYHPKIASDLDRWSASLQRLQAQRFDGLVWGHSAAVLYADAERRLREASESLGQYFVPWRRPMTAVHRYSGNDVEPGRVESPVVAP